MFSKEFQAAIVADLFVGTACPGCGHIWTEDDDLLHARTHVADNVEAWHDWCMRKAHPEYFDTPQPSQPLDELARLREQVATLTKELEKRNRTLQFWLDIVYAFETYSTSLVTLGGSSAYIGEQPIKYAIAETRKHVGND